jgi:hypothetical protein
LLICLAILLWIPTALLRSARFYLSFFNLPIHPRGTTTRLLNLMGKPYGGLPTELIHDIFDTLYDDSHIATLKACSLVDPLFCTLSQMRILSRVILHQENTYPTLSSPATIITPTYSPAVHFLQVLDMSPHIATYIQSLTIQCDWVVVGAIFMDHWVGRDTALAIVLPRLINLRRVSISGNRVVLSLKQHKPRPWDTVSQGLTSVFSNKIPSCALTDLDVTGIELFPIDFLRQCPSLKRLSMSSLHFDPEKKISAADEGYSVPSWITYTWRTYQTWKT